MNLLRSTFIAFCLTSSASAFAPQFTSKSLQRGTVANQHAVTTTQNSSRLFVGIHEPSPSSISDEDIQKETMFRQVLKEVSMAKEYLDWLIDESGAGDAPEEGADESAGPTMGEMLASQAAAGEVELLGGGGMMDAPSTSSEAPKETQYKPSLRSDLGTTVLLSGTADASLLTILNNNFFGQENVPNFEFGTIRALVDDTASAKKRAISREARYSGLLDKLVIEPNEGNALPKATELSGVGSWIVQIPAGDAGSLMPQIAELAKGCDELKNVVVLVTGSTSTATTVDGWDSVVGASADGEAFKCTVLAVGELYEGGKGGGFYHVGKLADGAPTAKINTKKAYQLAAHALSLDCTANEALTAFEYSPEVIEAVGSPYAEGELAVRDDDGNEIVDEFKDIKMEGRMVQACREVGFTPLVELDVMVGKGLEAYKAYLADPPNKENAFTKSKSKRDEQDEKIMAVLDAEIAKSDARKEAEAAEEKRIEVEGIAKEWAIKEYSLRMLVGDLDDSVAEKDFMISVWDDALAEASTTYDRIHSEAYIKQQERNEKEKVGIENKLFWDGMSPALRKKREKMVEKVKQQYMDLLSEEELEQIILSE